MANLTESKKRDFVSQLTVLLEKNTQLLTDKGYDPTAKITQLKTELTAADEAEVDQMEAKAAAKDATRVARETLAVAYTDASATVDLISGLLGKTDNLLLEIKKLRNSNKSPKSPVQPV